MLTPNKIRILTVLSAALIAAAALPASAGVRDVPVGVLFTHDAPDASQVCLAGSFNGWSADRNPMTKGEDGVWTLAMAMKPGRHEYKFVVDGSWFADAENPMTQPDSFGGANSLIEVDAEGGLVEIQQAAVAAVAGPNTTLNARVTVDGRYLGRYQARKNVDGDPRFRLGRAEQLIDLNVHTEVSDVVDAYTRLRMDNTRNVNLNQNTAFLDEGSVDVHPGPFHVLGFWDMETLQLGDPLSSGGDVDLPGTIFDDHLPSGKGSGGVVISGTPLGLMFEGFVADVHDDDWYNALELYDNTGKDVIGSRLSHSVGGFEIGLPIYMERELIWVDMSSAVGSTEGTGIAALDRHLAETDDSSTWYEWDDMDLRAGLDLTRKVGGDKGRVQLEWLYNSADQRFATGNEAEVNNTNGPVNIDLMTRTRHHYHGSFDWTFRKGRALNLEHTTISETGAQDDETAGTVYFMHEDDADKRVYVEFGEAPAALRRHYTELTLTNSGDGHDETLWLQRQQDELPDVEDSGDAVVTTLAARLRYGAVGDRYGAFELETAYTDHDDELGGVDGNTVEAILRWTRGLSRRVEAIADIRLKAYDLTIAGDEADVVWDDEFWAPYFGVRYLPHPKLDVVFAWGSDPLNFGIDYRGRHTGRWTWRQAYMYDNPGATEFEADRAMESMRAVGIRANFIF